MFPVQHDLWYNISAAKGSGVESAKYVILLRTSVSFKILSPGALLNPEQFTGRTF